MARLAKTRFNLSPPVGMAMLHSCPRCQCETYQQLKNCAHCVSCGFFDEFGAGAKPASSLRSFLRALGGWFRRLRERFAKAEQAQEQIENERLRSYDYNPWHIRGL